MKNIGCFKEFVKYSSLNVLGMIGLSCYILADTFFIAKGLGANGLAALNLAIPIYSFINGCGLMFGMGGATKYSILKSQNKGKEADAIFTHTIAAGAVVAFLFLLLGLLFSGGIAGILGANTEIFEMSRVYLQVILLFAPFFMLNNILLCFVRNDGAPQLSMFAMLGGSFSNIILDYIFIFPFGMGIFGAVLATGFAPIVSMIILSPYFLKKKNQFHFVKNRFAFHKCINILSGGVPSLVTEVSSGIVIIIFNKIILDLQGNIGVAAYGVIANISLVAIAVYTGIAQGIQPLVSKYYGAGQKKEVNLILRYALTAVVGISGVIYFSIFFGAQQIAGIFNSEHNMQLQDLAVWGLKIYFLACLFAGFNIIISVYFTSTECPRPAHLISIFRGFIVIIPMSFFLSSIGGMTGVWCAFPVTELIVAAAGMVYFVKRHNIDHRKQL